MHDNHTIIAIFVSTQDWIMLEYSDHTKSKGITITMGEAFVGLASIFSEKEWATLQKALKYQGHWILVE